MLITFQIVNKFVSIHNANAYEVLSDNYKYFTFGSHICSFIYMTTDVFPIWQTNLVLPHLCQYIEILHPHFLQTYLYAMVRPMKS